MPKTAVRGMQTAVLRYAVLAWTSRAWARAGLSLSGAWAPSRRALAEPRLSRGK